MNKKKYTKPMIKSMEIDTESLLLQASQVDNGSDSTPIEIETGDGGDWAD